MTQKPFIARDTKEPLVILGGYEIVEGGRIKTNLIDLNNPKPEATEDDIMLLDIHGVDELQEMQFYGVLDRLKNSGIIKDYTY